MINLYSLETERALLGLLLKKNKVAQEVFGFLRSEEFYDEHNKLLYSAIEQSYNNHEKIDVILVLPFLQEMQPPNDFGDWMEYLAQLTFEAGIESNLKDYIDLIKDRFQARRLEKTLGESVHIVSSKQKPVQEIIEEIEGKIFDVTRERELKDFKHVDEITKEFFSKMSDFENNIEEHLVKTGIKPLDDILGGFHPGDFVVIGARPSMGKTAVSLEFARNISQTKHVGFFSIEMPREQILLRMLSSISLIDSKNIRFPSRLNDRQKTQLEMAVEDVKKCNLHIDDSPSLKVSELTWKARKLRSLGKLDILIVDYLQIISATGNDRNFVMSEISRNLKQLARELQIPVIALSQLSRQTEKREDKRPNLSDIRESGAIEQDADIIMFLYREGYYKKSIIPLEVEDLEIIVAKHRNGPTGSCHVNFKMSLGRITPKKESNEGVKTYN